MTQGWDYPVFDRLRDVFQCARYSFFSFCIIIEIDTILNKFQRWNSMNLFNNKIWKAETVPTMFSLVDRCCVCRRKILHTHSQTAFGSCYCTLLKRFYVNFEISRVHWCAWVFVCVCARVMKKEIETCQYGFWMRVCPHHDWFWPNLSDFEPKSIDIDRLI